MLGRRVIGFGIDVSALTGILWVLANFVTINPFALSSAPLFYYLFLEGVTGRTLGKFLLGMKVVRSEDGGAPLPSQILLRTVCRLIPFDFLCAFIGQPTTAHDVLSDTRVVKR